MNAIKGLRKSKRPAAPANQPAKKKRLQQKLVEEPATPKSLKAVERDAYIHFKGQAPVDAAKKELAEYNWFHLRGAQGFNEY